MLQKYFEGGCSKMPNTTSTPPSFTRVLFPLKGNEAKVQEAASKFGIKKFGEYLLYEGYQHQDARNLLSGGVSAWGVA